MNEVQIIDNKLIIANNILTEMREYQAYKKEMDKKEKHLKAEILKAMKNNGIKSFENDLVKIVYVGESKCKAVDTDLLKSLDLYDEVLTETTKSDFIKMSYKADDEK